jgi:hypothetical protein
LRATVSFSSAVAPSRGCGRATALRPGRSI